MIKTLKDLCARSTIYPFLLVVTMQASCLEKRDGSGVNAIVDANQYTEAFGIISGIDYLPFKYQIDGCYARSLYMSMELAVKRIPSSAQFAFARPGAKPLTLANRVTWGYHVAPMIKNGASGTPTVLDPAMGTTSMPLRDWVERMGNVNPTLVVVPGTRYGNVGVTTASNKLISSFAELPSFSVRDVQAACNVMHNYLGREPSSGQTEQKRQKLLSRTGILLAGLQKVGKLPIVEGIRCGNTVVRVASASQPQVAGEVEQGPSATGEEQKQKPNVQAQNESEPGGNVLLDCNKDYTKIRQSGSGICVNSTSGSARCYRYSERDVQYDMGVVACPNTTG